MIPLAMASLPRTEQAVARSLAQTAEPGDALALALRAIGEGLEWRLGAVWEPAPDRPEALSCVDTWHAAGTAAEEFEAASRETRFAAGEGLPGRVWQSGEPAWIADVLADDSFPRASAARRAGLHAAFCFPIRSARGVLGVIEFFTGEPRQLDAALDCVVTIDHQGRVLDFNPAAERTFGYAAADAVGRLLAELIVPPELRERHRHGFARYLETGVPRVLDRRVELTGMRADGSTFPVELTITRIDLPDQPGFAGYLRDITERKQAEEELRASRMRIVEAAYAARRRIERDLHDGAQQRLVELALDLRVARARLDADPESAGPFLDRLADELAGATAELRELARGIHPAVLTDRGLAPAVAALAGRSAVPVELLELPEAQLPPPAQITPYFP